MGSYIKVLAGEIDLKSLNDSLSSETALPDKLVYNPTLVRVTLDRDSMRIGGGYVETYITTDEVTVEPLKYDIGSLNEYGYVMAHLLIRCFEIKERNKDKDHDPDYKLKCIGKLPDSLYRKLSSVKPIMLKDTNESFDVMGIQVFLNENAKNYNKGFFYKLNDDYILEVTEDDSVANIAKELMKHVTEITINVLGYAPMLGSIQLDKIYNKYKK